MNSPFEEVLRLFSGIVIADIETLVEYMAWDTYSSSMRGLSLTISLLQLPRQTLQKDFLYKKI